jgi:hypothetical protein
MIGITNQVFDSTNQQVGISHVFFILKKRSSTMHFILSVLLLLHLLFLAQAFLFCLNYSLSQVHLSQVVMFWLLLSTVSSYFCVPF